MVLRKIVKIDEDKCDGCGLCIPACHEGAIEIIDGKARLVDDKFCDGIGDCLGECPQDAIQVIEREAKEYDEEAVEKRMADMRKREKEAKQGDNHADHKGHHGGGCPGTRMMDLKLDEEKEEKISSNALSKGEGVNISSDDIEIKIKSQLKQWPVQLMLVPEKAAFFDGTELLLSADCVPVAYPEYHLSLLKGRSVAMGCPKLDDNNYYAEKLTSIINNNDITGITVAYMEVPCCMGIVLAAEKAIAGSSKDIELKKIKIGIRGEKEEI
ncbi:ATP-binding protein [Natronospora cellulosivora (SeqCode)]